MDQKIYLIPVGKVNKASLEKLLASLQKKFGYPVEIGKGI